MGSSPTIATRSGSTRIGGQGAEDTTTEIKEHSLRTMKLCQSGIVQVVSTQDFDSCNVGSSPTTAERNGSHPLGVGEINENGLRLPCELSG